MKINIEAIEIVFKTNEKIKFIKHNIGLLNLVATSVITNEYKRDYISELDLFVINNGIYIKPLNYVLDKLSSAQIRHIEITFKNSSTIRYYTTNEEISQIATTKNEYGDIVLSIHHKQAPLDLNHLDREAIANEIYNNYLLEEILV